jgi:hypothetical protein
VGVASRTAEGVLDDGDGVRPPALAGAERRRRSLLGRRGEERMVARALSNAGGRWARQRRRRAPGAGVSYRASVPLAERSRKDGGGRGRERNGQWATGATAACRDPGERVRAARARAVGGSLVGLRVQTRAMEGGGRGGEG